MLLTSIFGGNGYLQSSIAFFWTLLGIISSAQVSMCCLGYVSFSLTCFLVLLQVPFSWDFLVEGGAFKLGIGLIMCKMVLTWEIFQCGDLLLTKLKMKDYVGLLSVGALMMSFVDFKDADLEAAIVHDQHPWGWSTLDYKNNLVLPFICYFIALKKFSFCNIFNMSLKLFYISLGFLMSLNFCHPTVMNFIKALVFWNCTCVGAFYLRYLQVSIGTLLL